MAVEIKSDLYRIKCQSGRSTLVVCETREELFEFCADFELKGNPISSVTAVKSDGTSPRVCVLSDPEYKKIREAKRKKKPRIIPDFRPIIYNPERAQTVEAAEKVLDMDNSDVLCERLVDTFYKEFGDERFSKIGCAILNQYIFGSDEARNAMDYLFISLCGWSLTSLLKMCRLMDDTYGMFGGFPANYGDDEPEE